MEINALMEKAHRFARIGRYDEAIACYDKVLEIDGKNTTAMRIKEKYIIPLAGMKMQLPGTIKPLPSIKISLLPGLRKGIPCGKFSGTRKRSNVLTTLSSSIRTMLLHLQTKDMH